MLTKGWVSCEVNQSDCLLVGSWEGSYEVSRYICLSRQVDGKIGRWIGGEVGVEVDR